MMAIAFLGSCECSPIWYKYVNFCCFTAAAYVTKNIYSSNLKFKNLKKNFHKVSGTRKSIYSINRFYSTAQHSKEKISKVLQEFIAVLRSSTNLKPVFIFEDLKNQETKNKIKNISNNISGIYLILNKITLDYYIGSASTDKFYTRFYRHLINLTGSKIVKLAVKKYDLNKFAFIILELFPEKVNVENNKKLLDLEDFYLKSLLPNYNILTEASSSFGYKHTEIVRIKMKAKRP